jgi:hypothetical protein
MRSNNFSSYFAPGASFILISFFLLILLALPILCQTSEPESAAVSTTEKPTETKQPQASPAVKDLRGITIGMSADEIKDKLGKPESSDGTTMYFTLDNGESVQIGLDKDNKAILIADIFSGKDAKSPDLDDIFGTEVESPAGADGKVYKMVRYPTAGYWISYSRLDLKSGPMTTVTMQKMN